MKTNQDTILATMNQQVETLEKKIEEIEPSLFIRTNFLEDRIYKTINSLFLPVTIYNEHLKDYQNHWSCWWYLRDFLFSLDLFQDRWSNPDFRSGVELLNSMVEVVEKCPKKMEDFDSSEIGHRFFGYNDYYNPKYLHGVEQLMSALKEVIANQDKEGIKGIIAEHDMHDMLITLQIISSCQQIWAAASPEKTETETN